MLRIMVGPKSPSPMDKGTVTQDPTETEKPSKPKYDAEKASPQAAGYQGPDQGPFECSLCQHWQDAHSCNVVSGHIEEKGCCNLFSKNEDELEESPLSESPDSTLEEGLDETQHSN